MSTQTPTLEPVSTQSQTPGQPGGIQNALARFFNNLTGLLEYQRTANVFNTAQCAASGDNAVWTPSAASLKFRLMGGILTIPTNVARSAGGVITATFRDGTTDLKVTFDIFVPTTAVTTGNGDTTIPFNLPGNGILSATANNKLNLNLSAAITTGAIRATVWGCEE